MQVSVIFVIISVPTVHFQGLNQLECVWISSVAFWSGAHDCRVCTFTLPSQDLRLRWFYDEIGKRCEEETGELAGAVLVAASVLCFTVTASLTTEKKSSCFLFQLCLRSGPTYQKRAHKALTVIGKVTGSSRLKLILDLTLCLFSSIFF